MTLLNPWVWLGALLALLLAAAGGYWRGHSAASTACQAKAGAASAAVKDAQDTRDLAVEAIATATAAAVSAGLAENRSATDESTDRIRTVVVPGPCRAVDPGIVRELRQARDDANAALGVGVRPAAAGADPADP